MKENKTIKIAPSILAADFTKLGEEITRATNAGADRIHIDVMDGVFVPNISVGLPVVESIRKSTSAFLETHLMINNADPFIDDFAKAGSNGIIVHQEACSHLHRTIAMIKNLGLKAGVSLNPATPLNVLDEILPFLDLILIMTVNPGFGGQKFIETMPKKIETLKQMLVSSNLNHIEIEVDGGIDKHTAPIVAKAGADVLVAGSSVFNNGNPIEKNMETLLAVCQ